MPADWDSKATLAHQVQRQKTLLHCSSCDRDYHIIEKCYYLHSFPIGHKLHGKNVKPPNQRHSNANNVKVETNKDATTRKTIGLGKQHNDLYHLAQDQNPALAYVIRYWVYDLESKKFFSFVFHEHIFLFHANPQEDQHDVVVLPLPQASDEPITTKITETQADDQFFSLPPLFPSPVSTFNEPAPDYDTIVTPPPPVTHNSNRIKQPSVKL
ncbi:hypothetical protein AAG906_029114 [Vitis piasezkii]